MPHTISRSTISERVCAKIAYADSTPFSGMTSMPASCAAWRSSFTHCGITVAWATRELTS